MGKKIVNETRTVRFEENDNTQPSRMQLIRDYLEGQIFVFEHLKDLEFTIVVYSTEGNTRTKLAKRFSSLETVLDDVGGEYGDGNYELFINYRDEKNDTGFTKVSNVEIGGFGEIESEADPDPRSSQAPVQHSNNDVLIQYMMQQNQQNQALILAMIEKLGGQPAHVPQGGGMKEIIEAIQLGATLAGNNAGSDDKGFDFMSMLPALLSMRGNKNVPQLQPPEPPPAPVNIDPQVVVQQPKNGQHKKQPQSK